MKLAAIDIGSNSLHLLIARIDHAGRFRVLHKEKKMIRLGAQSLQSGEIPQGAAQRAIGTLRRFASGCRTRGVEEIAAVATSAVREARNRDEFLWRIEKEVGLIVRVLSGKAEGRLIALAVARFNRGDLQKDLIVDIGGGSTELILLREGEHTLIDSLKLGSVRLTERFLRSDPTALEEVGRLREHVCRLMDKSAAKIRSEGFDRTVGTSGTIRALARMSLWTKRSPSDLRRSRLTLELGALQALNQRLFVMTLEERSKLPGLPGRRADIIVAGGLLLEEIMIALGVGRLTTCPWALREGLLLDAVRERGLSDLPGSTRPSSGRMPATA